MSRRALLLAASLVALVALAAVWLVENVEKVPVKVRVPASGAARLREFLAAERLAERMGLPARELRSLTDLDALPGRGVLLLPGRRQAIDAARLDRLLAWTRAGGHLVVEAELPGVDDRILASVGILRGRRKADEPLTAEIDGERFVVSFPGGIGLRSRAKPRLQIADQLVTIAHGKGLVTAVSSLDFARNDAIGEHDHAALLWKVLTLAPAPSLQVFFRPQRLSLWSFLSQHAAPALAGALALLVFWLWRIAPRFGPVPADAPPARRRLLDHLRASGRYLWTQGQRGRLAAAARDAALRRLARAQPDFAAAAASEKAARLAAIAAVTPEEAQRFLAAGGAVRGADFVRLAAIAQRIHLALEKGSR